MSFSHKAYFVASDCRLHLLARSQTRLRGSISVRALGPSRARLLSAGHSRPSSSGPSMNAAWIANKSKEDLLASSRRSRAQRTNTLVHVVSLLPYRKAGILQPLRPCNMLTRCCPMLLVVYQRMVSFRSVAWHELCQSVRGWGCCWQRHVHSNKQAVAPCSYWIQRSGFSRRPQPAPRIAEQQDAWRTKC